MVFPCLEKSIFLTYMMYPRKYESFGEDIQDKSLLKKMYLVDIHDISLAIYTKMHCDDIHKIYPFVYINIVMRFLTYKNMRLT